MQQRFDEAKAQNERDLAECARLYPDRFKKPTVPRIRCINDAQTKFSSAVGDPYYDLGQVLGSQILMASEQYDAGHLSQIQYEAAIAKAKSDFTSQIAQRNNNAAVAHAAQEQAAAASWQAYTAGQRRSVTCTTWSNTMTCN
jgi:hypothetical protein